MEDAAIKVLYAFKGTKRKVTAIAAIASLVAMCALGIWLETITHEVTLLGSPWIYLGIAAIAIVVAIISLQNGRTIVNLYPTQNPKILRVVIAGKAESSLEIQSDQMEFWCEGKPGNTANDEIDPKGYVLFHSQGKPIVGFEGQLGTPRSLLKDWMALPQKFPAGTVVYELEDIALFVVVLRNHAATA